MPIIIVFFLSHCWFDKVATLLAAPPWFPYIVVAASSFRAMPFYTRAELSRQKAIRKALVQAQTLKLMITVGLRQLTNRIKAAEKLLAKPKASKPKAKPVMKQAAIKDANRRPAIKDAKRDPIPLPYK